MDDEEYAVLSSLIDSYTGREVKLAVVMEDHTKLWRPHGDKYFARSVKRLKAAFPELDSEILRDFTAKNSQRHALERRFATKAEYVLASSQDVARALGAERQWDNFRRRYPSSHGLTTISRVGFNAGRTQALVYRGDRFGGKAGVGNYLLLVKKDGAWAVVRGYRVWVS